MCLTPVRGISIIPVRLRVRANDEDDLVPYKSRKEQREYQSNWAKKRRVDWVKKNGPCVLCGKLDDLCVHHVDSKKKVAHRIWSWAELRRVEELKKCIVLCQVCHRQWHSAEFPVQKHGTRQRYKSLRFPCRCDACRRANAEYQRKRRRSRKTIG